MNFFLQKCLGESRVTLLSERNMVWEGQVSTCFFILANWWLAYFFLQTTTIVEPQLLYRYQDSIPEEAKIKQAKKYNRQTIIFLTIAGIEVIITIIKVAISSSEPYDLQETTSLLFCLSPVVFSVATLIPLLITFVKLRSYKKKYGMKIERFKLVMHMIVCIMILLLYIFNFLLQYSIYDLLKANSGENESQTIS